MDKLLNHALYVIINVNVQQPTQDFFFFKGGVLQFVACRADEIATSHSNYFLKIALRV